MIVSLLNMKGGVGKTTLTVNLAIGLARYHKKKVLLVDLDPQFNATQYLMKPDDYLAYIRDKNKLTVKDLFVERITEGVGIGSKAEIKEVRIKPTKENCCLRVVDESRGYVDLIPSRLELMEADTLDRGIENKLKNFLDKIKDAYDIILIDCPPTISLFTISAYIASDSYFTPIKPDYLSSVGLSLIGRAMERFEDKYGKKINYAGLAFVMVQKNNLMKKTIATLRSVSSNKCFDNMLSQSTKIAEQVEKHKSIFDLDLRYRYGSEMKKITDEFATKMGI